MIRTGDTTITVSDAGGAVKMCVEDARFKKEAKAEFDEVRRAMMEDFDASRLVAGGYPNGGMVPKKGKPAKDDSPKAFCGVAFGSLPTPGTHIVVVPETGVKTFFLDYQVRATSPFARQGGVRRLARRVCRGASQRRGTGRAHGGGACRQCARDACAPVPAGRGRWAACGLPRRRR